MGSVKAIIPRLGMSLMQRDTQQSVKVALSPSPAPVGFGVPLLRERAMKKEVCTLRGTAREEQSGCKSTNFLSKTIS